MIDTARIAAFLLPFFLGSAYAGNGCPDQYIKRDKYSAQKESTLYLIQVPRSFDSSRADIKATYDSISSSRNPTYQCFFNDLHQGWAKYLEGTCKNMVTGKQSSVFGGNGYEIRQDGYTTITGDCYSKNHSGRDHIPSCAYIEDSNGNRIAIDAGIVSSLDGSYSFLGYVLQACNTGAIEALTFRGAFPGYIILERAIEKGFVNTYNGAPNIKF